MKLSLFTVLVLGLMLMVLAQAPEKQITRLSPTAFPELPTNLVQELQRRQCTIAQAYVKKYKNVIKGEFARPGQTDWAVLCSVKGVSTILVFWNGSEKDPAALAPMQDNGYVQGLGGAGQWGYSRGIEPMGMADIVRYHDPDHLGDSLPPIDHQGINDQYLDKAFLVWYYYDGQWLKVAAGD